jgi:long-chain fatty acid transport protein
VPFGLETSYNDGWKGRYHALDSELMTVNFNPAVSYEPMDGVAIGAGLQAQYVTAELSNAVDFGSITGRSPGRRASDGEAEVEGDDWGFGFNLGVIVEPREGTRIGAAYRSEIEHELDGDVDFSAPTGVISGIQSQPGTPNDIFNDTGASADLTTPDLVSLGVYQEVTSNLAVMGEFQYTFWSDFQELRIEFDNSTRDSVTEEDWNDSFFVSAGAKYDVSDALSLRTGVAFDESPIPDETRTPRIPGNDRTWLSIGANYSPYAWFTVNAAYTHLFVKDGDIDLDASDPGNASRGSLNAEVENSVDVATVSATLRF